MKAWVQCAWAFLIELTNIYKFAKKWHNTESIAREFRKLFVEKIFNY